jgi:hypothetical protein
MDRLQVELVGADGYHLRSVCSGSPRREGPRRAVASAGYVQADRVSRAHPLGRPATRPDNGACHCYPTTNSGNCYEPAGYRRTSDRGTYGVAGNGEKIICEDNNGWRWEPVEALNLYDLPFGTGCRFFQILVRQQVQQWQRALARRATNLGKERSLTVTRGYPDPLLRPYGTPEPNRFPR